jgi:hypothetical protein
MTLNYGRASACQWKTLLCCALVRREIRIALALKKTILGEHNLK